MTLYKIANAAGRTYWWPLSRILSTINGDRSGKWVPYDENDWPEGLDAFTDYRAVRGADGKPVTRESSAANTDFATRPDDSKRILRMSEDDGTDDLAKALADYVADDPNGVNSVKVRSHVRANGGHEHRVEAVVTNSVGPTVNLDGILEALNMYGWRLFCDKLLENVVDMAGGNSGGIDWPTPFPNVTHVPESFDNEATDITYQIRVEFTVDPTTAAYVRQYEEIKRLKANADAGEVELTARESSAGDEASSGEVSEETCSNCEEQIRYCAAPGRTIVICPKCGAANPLCNACDRQPEGCDDCETVSLCATINRLRAMTVAE